MSTSKIKKERFFFLDIDRQKHLKVLKFVTPHLDY